MLKISETTTKITWVFIIVKYVTTRLQQSIGIHKTSFIYVCRNNSHRNNFGILLDNKFYCLSFKWTVSLEIGAIMKWIEWKLREKAVFFSNIKKKRIFNLNVVAFFVMYIDIIASIFRILFSRWWFWLLMIMVFLYVFTFFSNRKKI